MSSALILSALVLPQVWTVDDDGPADFPDVGAALAVVAPGDTLLIEPGTYPSFVLDRSLTLLGRAGAPRPLFSFASTVTDVGSVTLSGLQFGELRLVNVAGRARIDDCLIAGSFDFSPYGTFNIEDCNDVVVTRTTSFGLDGTDPIFDDCTAGVFIQGSVVQLVDSAFHGGEGPGSILEAFSGCDGIQVSAFGNPSQVIVAGCDASGGPGGCDLLGCEFDGHGVRGGFGNLVNVRGSSQNVIAGELSLFGDVSYSGVSLVGPPSGQAVEMSPTEPYLIVRGEDEPGEVRRLQLFGPAGASALVVTSIVPDQVLLPGVASVPIFLKPSQILTTHALVTPGPDVPASLNFPIPTDPAFTGLSLIVQAALIGQSPFYGTNSSNLIVRF